MRADIEAEFETKYNLRHFYFIAGDILISTKCNARLCNMKQVGYHRNYETI